MPSGAKKRKAAKKKKTSTTTTTTTTKNPTSTSTSTSREDGNRKQYESDSEYQMTEGEEEDIEKKTGETFRFEGKKTVDVLKNGDRNVEKVIAEKKGIVQIKGDSDQEKEFDKKRGSSQSSRSRSSSDDESRSVQNNVDSGKEVGSFSEWNKQVTQTTQAENVPLLNEEVLEGSGASAAKSLSSDVGAQKEIGEGKLSSLELNSRPPRPVVPENKKDEKTNGGATSNAKEHAAHENEEKLMVSYNAPRDDAINDAERVKDSEVHGSSDRQPLIASPPQAVKTTSWKSCCGLFEAFTGSNA